MAPQNRLTETLDRIEMPEEPAGDAGTLLRVEGLSVAYGGRQVVSGVGFGLRRGESLALIGESGSGKTTIARSVLRLLPEGIGRATGLVEFDGQDILSLPERRFRPLRGRRIGFVPQDPGNALNPVRTIGSQAKEAAALLDEPNATRREELVLKTFAQVGLDDPGRVYDSYPHQLSGGMLQRVLIGLTVLPRPALIVADEPTSALDVTIQKRILDLLSRLQRDLNISLLLITHDLAIAAERADSLVVLKDGVVQDAGGTTAVFSSPSSDYTRRLHADVPALNPHRYRHLRDAGRKSLPVGTGDRPKIEVDQVTKTYTVAGRPLTAVDDVSFSVEAGTTHALVGESGSGKTTTIRLLLGLEQPDHGSLKVAGEEVAGGSHASLRSIHRHLQLVYQNPFTSLDPTWKVERLVREPLDRFRIGTRQERAERVREALRSVGLAEDLRSRKPGALSGGQRQRVAIARSLVLRPDVIVLDEPTSALDVSVQADIVDVLLSLQAELGLTYVFVSHDLALVRQFAHTVSVMHQGRIVESGTVDTIFGDPQQPYTRTLIESISGGATVGTGFPGEEPRGNVGEVRELPPRPPVVRSPASRVLITADELAEELRSPNPPVVLDVRWALGDPDGHHHFTAGHVPGAGYVDLEAALANKPSSVDGRHPLPDPEDLQEAARQWGIRNASPVVVYDDSGNLAAARAWWLLRWGGVPDVRLLDGGLNAWRARGGPIQSGLAATVPEGDVVITPGHLPVLDADEAAGFPDQGVLLDARAGERYRGEAEPVDPRAGHIPGAVSAPTADNLTADGRFRSPTELAERFQTLGAEPGGRVAVYCGSGITAAHQVAALALAGVDAALYPGSWSQWAADPNRPAVTGPNP